MTLDEFKDVYSGKTPVEKLRLMVDQFDNWRNDAKNRVDANWRGNFDEAAYYASECEAMKERVVWLYAEISNVLKAQEPVEPTLRGGIGGYWYCGACNYQISRGDKFCRYCGQAVKWK